MEKTIQRLMNAIKNGKFAFEKYYNRSTWYGLEIEIRNYFCSYGRIGYDVFGYDERGRHVATITHDSEMDKTEVEYINI